MTDLKLNKTQCVACKEPIQPSAKICPQCGSSQQSDKWAGLRKILKIVAGLTAILSLIIVATEITNLASQDRRSRIDAIDLVKAAQLLWEAKDESAALSLLEKADVVYPNLRETRTLRANIGISSISLVNPLSTVGGGLEELSIKPDKTGTPEYMYWSTIKRKDIESLLKIVSFPESLAIIAEESTGSKRARALAYMAWVELILNPGMNIDIDIDKIFNRAIEASEDDAIANLLRAAWLASNHRYKGPLKDTERLELSKASFNKVLAQCIESDIEINNLSLRRWTRALQINTLPAVEALAVVQEMLLNREPSAKNTLGLTRRLFISLSGWGSAPYPENVKNIETELMSRYKPAKLAEVATELASIHFGCQADEYCTGDGRESGQMLFAIGRMHELAENQGSAYDYYKKAKDHAGLSGWWESSFKNALQRTEPTNN